MVADRRLLAIRNVRGGRLCAHRCRSGGRAGASGMPGVDSAAGFAVRLNQGRQRFGRRARWPPAVIADDGRCVLTRTWMSIRVDLVEGRGEQYWPRPGRIFAAARSHTFKEFADAID